MQTVTTAIIDNGYYDTKAIIKNQLMISRSKIEKHNGTNFGENYSVLEYNGKEYAVGIGKDDINIDKTKDLVHKICTLNALGSVTDYSDAYNLVLALPMQHFKNKEFREEFKRYMMNPSIVNFRLNGKKKIITIKDVTVFMQTAAALYAEPEKYKNKLVAVIDIGGLTINGCIFENLTPIMETMITINAGTLILANKIKSALNEVFTMNVQDYEIPYLISEEKYKSVTDHVINLHFEDVKREMMAKNWNLQTIEKLGIGGGMLKIKECAKRHFSNLNIPEEPQLENVKGLQAIGEMVYGI